MNNTPKPSAIIFAGILLIVGANHGLAQKYSSDLSDITISTKKITPIGDLAPIDKVIDLRGFVPLSIQSKERSDYQTKSVFNFFTDIFQWYQIPTKTAVGLLYYGVMNDDIKAQLSKNKESIFAQGKESVYDNATKEKLAKLTLIQEENLTGVDLQWAKFSYDIKGKELFKGVGGTTGLESAEPVMILLTAKSSIILVSFKYTDNNRQSTGQIMCAFEFSRALKEYKTFYEIYSTTRFSRSTKECFETSFEIFKAPLKLLKSGEFPLTMLGANPRPCQHRGFLK